MWPDDIYWFELYFSGKNFKGQFHFQDHDTILKSNLEEVGQID